MALRIPFNPGFLNISQSPSTLAKAIEPSSFFLQSGCKLVHHASNDFSKAGMLVMTGRQVVECPRQIHSDTHGNRPSGDSFCCSVKISFFSNADHNLRSSAHWLPNSLFCSMASEFENHAGGNELVEDRVGDDLLHFRLGRILRAWAVGSGSRRVERRVVVG
jgi:hypothetical protein